MKTKILFFLFVFSLLAVECLLAQRGAKGKSNSLLNVSSKSKEDLSKVNHICLDIEDYGVIINGEGDNTIAFQNAIDEAALTGSCLQMKAGVIRIAGTLNLKAGVTLTGAGRGPGNLTRPAKGTVILYTGDSSAITITGSNTCLNNFVVYNENGHAKYGLLIHANNNLIESIIVTNLLLYGITSGTALKLFAENSGGICYSSFYDLRIRDAKTGIEIDKTDAASFVNSNSFFHGVISGDGYDNCILINTGNNNVFYSTVIEPYTSTNGHLVVNSGQVIGENIRIEAAKQSASKPVIKFGEASSGSLLSGIYGGGLIVNKGNNEINLTSSKAIGENNPGYNMFVNAEFLLPDSNNVPAFWQFSNPGVSINATAQTIINGERVICLKVPPNTICDFMPQSGFQPELTNYPSNRSINVSVLVKTNKGGCVKVTYNYEGGIVSSVAHSGSNEWENIGLQAITNIDKNPAPKININNKDNIDTLVVYLTSPSFNTGLHAPQRNGAVITSAGGIISGTVTNGLCSNYSFIKGTNYLILPKTGNIFIIDGTGNTISRINHQREDWFPVGTIITVLFNNKGNTITNNIYVRLKSSFLSSGENTSITIVSNGDGTWREMNRNN